MDEGPLEADCPLSVVVTRKRCPGYRSSAGGDGRDGDRRSKVGSDVSRRTKKRILRRVVRRGITLEF